MYVAWRFRFVNGISVCFLDVILDLIQDLFQLRVPVGLDTGHGAGMLKQVQHDGAVAGNGGGKMGAEMLKQVQHDGAVAGCWG